MRATVTTISVFVLSVLLRVLFFARTGEWEFVGRVLEESRPVPAMSVTTSKNKTGWSSLVGSPNSCFTHQNYI
ncbi:hypothetical protein [Aerosakkonema funiforme]|uniref:hypothetical protein n=1 Tax=Aerosakkonema funiforme TaxID=1246630 RepID=UPI0035B9A599